MTSSPPIIVWFRQDLRLADNAALCAAAANGRAIIPLYIHDEQTPGRWAPGGASRWWLDKSLAALEASLAGMGGYLQLRAGMAGTTLDAVIAASGATGVYWSRCYEPHAIERDTRIKARLAARGLDVQSFDGGHIAEPWDVTSSGGGPFRVFSPFWRAVRIRDVPAPRPAPDALRFAPQPPGGVTRATLGLHPTRPDWSGGLAAAWTPGEAGAQTRLERFLEEALETYADGRDIPGEDHTSRLSPHLHFGEISARTVWHAARDRARSERRLDATTEKFLSEIGWREFSTHLLFHNPDLPDANLQKRFDGFPWATNAESLAAWQQGRTGYPIVDAGMRELWTTGWMHNRVRMITASFLVKHLLVDWREGEAWFWDTLVDADLANNAASWQWVAGCGADAAPYFRIFNPILQAKKFDPDGTYIRRWVGELRDVPTPHLFAPWEAPKSVLDAANIELGRDYPQPVVDHGAARERALAAFERTKAA